MSINIPILCGNVDSFKTTFMVICSVQSTTTRRAAILRRVVTVATARCSAYCVFAQRFSIQPLGSLGWPEAEQKHTPQACVEHAPVTMTTATAAERRTNDVRLSLQVLT